MECTECTVESRVLPHLQAIHWLYGDGDYQLSAGCAGDPLRRLYLCGDWCYNGRVEGAWMKLGQNLVELGDETWCFWDL